MAAKVEFAGKDVISYEDDQPAKGVEDWSSVQSSGARPAWISSLTLKSSPIRAVSARSRVERNSVATYTSSSDSLCLDDGS